MYCGTTPHWICTKCSQGLGFVEASECPICRCYSEDNLVCRKCHRDHYIQKLEYLFEYTGAIKQLLKTLKYTNRFSIRYDLARLLIQWMITHNTATHKTLWTFAPSSQESISKRGFNQVKEILLCASQLSKLNWVEVFEKKSGAKRQATLDRNRRLTEIKGKISIAKNCPPFGQIDTIYILDDIATTGSTLNECCRVLLARYPSIKIICVTFARGKALHGGSNQ